jgi:hypothetical protein
MDNNDSKKLDEQVNKAYEKMISNASKLGITEKQLLFVLSEVIDMVAPSFEDLQRQIDELKHDLKASQKDESLKNRLEEMQKNA